MNKINDKLIEQFKEETKSKIATYTDRRGIFRHTLAYVNWLEQQIENLKCCGNCKFDPFLEINCIVNIKFKKLGLLNYYCENWQSDSLTQEERK